MLKPILTFSAILFLAACTSVPVKQIPTEVRSYKKVNFFAADKTVAAFKIVGRMNDFELEGVLRIQKIGPDDFTVQVLTGGAYRVLQATVAPEGIAYHYLFPEADTPLVRGRVNQFLQLLVNDIGVYKRYRIKDGHTMIMYNGKDAKTRFLYQNGVPYPYAAQTVTLLNTADLFYNHYMPVDADGYVQIPHELVYKDGNIELELTLISIK